VSSQLRTTRQIKVEIVVLLYNRPDHARAVFDSLAKNGVSAVSVFMDAPDRPETAERQKAMIDELSTRPGLEVTLFRHRERQGLAKSVRFALATVFERSDGAILLEDDCVVRPGGIDFLRAGLEALQHDRRVRSLCGYLYPCGFIRSDGAPIVLQRFCTWGWATWRDRWQDYNPDLLAVLRKLEARGVRIDELTNDIAALCRSEAYLQNRVDIWSVPWILEHYATNTFSVYPCDSLIDNIGFDGSGQNCVVSSDFASAGRASARPWDYRQISYYVENEDLLRQFLEQHGSKTYPGP
jgi:hypothetical protein